MKKILFATIVGFSALASFAVERTPEQVARIRASRAARLAANGGLVKKPQTGNIVRIVSTQKQVSIDAVRTAATDANRGLNVILDVAEMPAGKDVLEDVAAVMKQPKTGAALLVVEDGRLPTLLSAPESGWAILNVKALSDDLPPREVFEARVKKEVSRALASAFGAGVSFNKPCVMDNVCSKFDLDAIKMTVPGPEALSKMLDACRLRNIQPVRITNYRQACQEGWAPSPTNDVQKKIWGEVHALPKNSLKIEFDPKKGR